MEKLIEVRNLSKKYQDNLAVNKLSFDVNKGEIFGLLGANGAGKSTTIECILGTKKLTEGEVLILGKNPNKDRKKLFEEIGVQFQEAAYPSKILMSELCEQIECLYKETADYKELLKQFDIIEKLNSPISELSGGQKQKLFIVLSLIPKPKVLFLDEITTGLDPKARRDVWKILKTLKEKGITILLTSHFMDEVENLCDHILIIKTGKKVFEGTVIEAIEKSPYNKLEDAYLWYIGEDENNENI